ncbi:MAG: hypothetical protein GX458_16715 [Phyllobacteriaceae bacterium]|nr:hypothetical protein [Phyllobacteriaceae bacterium]
MTQKLRRGELRAVGRVGNPNASYEELTASTWIEYVFASYPESFAAHRRDLEDRIYDVRIAPHEWGDALVRKQVHGERDASDGPDRSRNKGGTPGNPHWEEVFDALLAPLIRPAEFESQRHLIEAIEETFQKLGYEPPTQDGIRKRLGTKWPNLKALAAKHE